MPEISTGPPHPILETEWELVSTQQMTAPKSNKRVVIKRWPDNRGVTMRETDDLSPWIKP